MSARGGGDSCLQYGVDCDKIVDAETHIRGRFLLCAAVELRNNNLVVGGASPFTEPISRPAVCLSNRSPVDGDVLRSRGRTS